MTNEDGEVEWKVWKKEKKKERISREWYLEKKKEKWKKDVKMLSVRKKERKFSQNGEQVRRGLCGV